MYDRNFIPQPKEFEEKVVAVNRVSKKTKGVNRMRFAALVVVGDKKGKVGVGLGKAADVSSAIKKASNYAQQRMTKIEMKGNTIPHEMRIKMGAAKLLLKPAPQGSGVIAGGAVRSVMEVTGIRDVVGKILGSNNKISNVYATFAALKRLKNREKGKV